MLKYVFLVFLLGYAFTFIDPTWNTFVQSHCFAFMRWANVPESIWLFMDNHVPFFNGRL
jgi:hypothetical protein